MNWSVPAAIKWIRALEQFDLQYVEQPVPDFDLAGHGAGAARRLDADRRRRGVHERPLGARADQGRRLRRLRRLPVRGGRADARAADRARSRRPPASGARSAAGPSSASRRPPTRTSPPRRRTSRSPTTPTIHCSCDDVLDRAVEIEDGRIAVSHDPGLGVALDPESVAHARGARAPRVTVLRRHQGRRPERRPDPLSVSHPEEEEQQHVRQADESSLSRADQLRELLEGRRGRRRRGRRRRARRPGGAATQARHARRRRRSDGRHGHLGARAGSRASSPRSAAILTINRTAQRADVRLAARVGPEAEHPPGARDELRRSSTRSGSSGTSARASSSTTARS